MSSRVNRVIQRTRCAINRHILAKVVKRAYNHQHLDKRKPTLSKPLYNFLFECQPSYEYKLRHQPPPSQFYRNARIPESERYSEAIWTRIVKPCDGQICFLLSTVRHAVGHKMSDHGIMNNARLHTCRPFALFRGRENKKHPRRFYRLL